MNTQFKAIIAIVAAGIGLAGLIIWVVFFKTPTITPDTSQPQFGSSDTTGSTGVTPIGATNEAQTVTEGTSSTQKVFKIADGPIAGATLVETTRPTSTLARYVLANSGHTFELTIDSPGAVPKAISNTTIPGIARVFWSEGGRGALLHYIDSDTLKTVHLALPPIAATTTTPVRIQFLPTGATGIAVSPDGASVAYLLLTASGSDGYTARADGANAKKLFSLPFSQLLLSWPAPSTLLVQTPAAAGTVGAAFSVDTKTGATTALLSASGLSVTADRTFSRMLYQTRDAENNSYLLNSRTGLALPLSFDPIPELCRWGSSASSTVYCAVPLSFMEPFFLDLLHLGAVTKESSLVRFDGDTGYSDIIATPGSREEGGEPADITEITLSQNETYMLYIRKSDRSLWGVRLGSTR